MNYGSHIASIVGEDGNQGDFFTGTESECRLWAAGVEAGRRAASFKEVRIVKPEIVTIAVAKALVSKKRR